MATPLDNTPIHPPPFTPFTSRSTTIPKSKHDIPSLPINPASRAAAPAKPFTRPHYTQYDAETTNSYHPAPAAAQAPAQTRVPAYARAPAQPPSRYHQQSNAPSSPPPPQRSDVEPSPSADNEYVRKLQMENEVRLTNTTVTLHQSQCPPQPPALTLTLTPTPSPIATETQSRPLLL